MTLRPACFSNTLTLRLYFEQLLLKPSCCCRCNTGVDADDGYILRVLASGSDIMGLKARDDLFIRFSDIFTSFEKNKKCETQWENFRIAL